MRCTCIILVELDIMHNVEKFLGVYNAWISAKEIPESMDPNIFDCCGFDLLCVYQVLGEFSFHLLTF